MMKKILSKDSVKTVLYLLSVIVVIVGCNSPAFAALSDTQRQLLQNNVLYFDSSTCGNTTSTTTSSPNSSTLTEDQKIAQTFIVGFDASMPKSVIQDLVSKYHIGGMYLIGTTDAAAAGFNKQFFDGLNQAAGTPLTIASDEEGGLVHRFSYPDISGGFPSAKQMGSMSDSQVQQIGKQVGNDLKAGGVTTDLAPVLDLDDGSNIIAQNGRSFSSNSGVVAEKAQEFAQGLASSGVTPLFKHFPGFGGAGSGNTDTTAVTTPSTYDLKANIAPYQKLLSQNSKSGVMLSNLFVPQLTKGKPASISPDAVTYLRNVLSYNGPITTDDLAALSNYGARSVGLSTAISDALQAGVDMPLFGIGTSDQTAAESKIQSAIDAVKANVTGSTIDAAVTQVMGFKGTSSSTPALTPTTSTSCSCSSGSSATSLSGSDKETQIWNYFKTQGLSDEQTAGVMGNIEQESSFNPTEIESGGNSNNPADAGSGGWGLVQWTPGSTALTAQSDNHISGNIYDPLTQLNVIWAQMKGTSPKGETNILKGLQAINDPSQAATYFNAHFEGGTDPSNVRETNAVTILSKYKGSGGGPVGTSTGGCAPSASSSPDCTTAAGDTKILCEAKQYDPVSYSESAAGNHMAGGNPAWLKTCPQIGPSCYLDCSGLVNIAVYDAFGYDLKENTTAEAADTANWKHISLSQLQPGDLIQPAAEAGGHVEIVDHVKGGTIYTFGAHQSGVPQPDQVSPASFQPATGDLYLHWIGQGSS